MHDRRRQQIIESIRAKALHIRLLRASQTGHHMRHDPEPQTPDVMQTVGLRSDLGQLQ